MSVKKNASALALHLLLIFISLEISGQTHAWQPFRGKVYELNSDIVTRGYSEEVLKRPILTDIRLDSLNIPSTEFSDLPFPGVVQNSGFGIVFHSALRIFQAGCYELSLTSDDGSKLWLNGEIVLDNDRPHGMRRICDTLRLGQADHPVKVWYYNGYPTRYGLELDVRKLPDSTCQKTFTLGDLLFDTNSHQLSPAGEAAIAERCALLRSEYVSRITVVGHTDDQGQKSYNQRLSQMRAEAVKASLAQCLGDQQVEIVTVGYGPNRPIARNDDDEGRRLNRRVEVLVE